MFFFLQFFFCCYNSLIVLSRDMFWFIWHILTHIIGNYIRSNKILCRSIELSARKQIFSYMQDFGDSSLLLHKRCVRCFFHVSYLEGLVRRHHIGSTILQFIQSILPVPIHRENVSGSPWQVHPQGQFIQKWFQAADISSRLEPAK